MKMLKRRLTEISLALLMCLAAAPTIMFVGCSTVPTTQEAKTFNTFRDTWTVTYAAYQLWCERVVQGKVTSEQETQGDQVWNAFRTSFKSGLIVASHNWNAPPPSNVAALAAQATATFKQN